MVLGNPTFPCLSLRRSDSLSKLVSLSCTLCQYHNKINHAPTEQKDVRRGFASVVILVADCVNGSTINDDYNNKNNESIV